MFIRFTTTGGAIDKIYFDDLSQFEVGESQVQRILAEGLAAFDIDVVPLMHTAAPHYIYDEWPLSVKADVDLSSGRVLLTPKEDAGSS